MNKLIIPAIIGIFGLAPGTVTANAAESTTASFSVQILKKKPKALKYGLKHGVTAQDSCDMWDRLLRYFATCGQEKPLSGSLKIG